MPEKVANRIIYGQALVELGQQLDNLVVLDADISISTNTCQFAERFPDRFFNIGVAEQNMIGIAAGLATTGQLPFASTFAIFASLRASEQVRTSIAYPRLNVKIVASNAGVEICGDGVTHQAVEDLAVMRAIANMVVVSPSDPVTTRQAVHAMAAYDGPVYMRLGRQAVAPLHDAKVPFELGRMLPLRSGCDAAIIATGHMVHEALRAADELARQRIEVRVLDCHTIKPLDVDSIVSAARETNGIVTAEDHNIIGGLGAAVCEVVAQEYPSLVHRVGLRDCFASSARDYRQLLAHYRMDAKAMVHAVKALLEQRKQQTREASA
jgi:transketolase